MIVIILLLILFASLAVFMRQYKTLFLRLALVMLIPFLLFAGIQMGARFERANIYNDAMATNSDFIEVLSSNLSSADSIKRENFKKGLIRHQSILAIRDHEFVEFMSEWRNR